MVQLSRKTIEDLLGNVADDAKQALDEVLERDKGTTGGAAGGVSRGVGASPLTRPGSAASGVGSLPGGSGAPSPTLQGGALGGVAGSVGNVAQMGESLASLPAKIDELSKQISKLLTALEGFSKVAGAAGKASGGAKKGT